MLVSRADFPGVLARLLPEPKLGIDTETTGLRPYHGDRLFSIILSTKDEAWYFNFQAVPDIAEDQTLLPGHLEDLQEFCGTVARTWIAHRATFDLHMLAQEGIFLKGEIHCTRVGARIVYNEHHKYTLDACAERDIELRKDDAVERYIEDHHLWDWETAPGKKKRTKNKHYDRVPSGLIVPYGEQDAKVCFGLAECQEKEIERVSHETPPGLPTLRALHAHERKLTRTTFRMERIGLKIDRPYCLRAALYEDDRASKAADQFRVESGRHFKASGQLFAEVFADEKDKWEYTDKGNPSFEGDVLTRFESPAAKAILQYRDAKSKADFYRGFLYHADRDDIVHPNLNQDGTRFGRYSSSDPNFQNLTAEEGEDLNQEFVVRRAIIPRPGFVLFMPDWDQVEYRLMLEYAARAMGRETELITKVKAGLDVHEASRQLILQFGIDLPRGIVKNGNFAVLYGAGYETLSWTIKGTIEAAKSLKQAIFTAAPEIKQFVRGVSQTVEKRGYLFNWFGRRLYFPDRNLAYKGPNGLIQGGCADIMKKSMTEIDDYLQTMKSRMILTVHDELPTEIHESEVASVPRRMVEIMEQVFPHKYLPLTVSAEWSEKSLADKRKGFPV